MENNELPYSFGGVGESHFAEQSPIEDILTKEQEKVLEMEPGMLAKIEGEDGYYVVKNIDKENLKVTLERALEEGTNTSYGVTVGVDKISDFFYPKAEA